MKSSVYFSSFIDMALCQLAMSDLRCCRGCNEESSGDGEGEGGKRNLPVESVKKVEFNGNLVTYATRDSILLAVPRIIDGDTWIKRERGIKLVETHESTKVVVDGDIHVHSTGDPGSLSY